MPRDRRFYMTYPQDFHRHPKIQRLPPDVRWTFVEMNGEACMANNDGVFATEEAEFMWPKEHLDLLCSSHPTRPLVVRTSDGYQIREYREHQMTAADREASHEAAVRRGRSGGLASAQARSKSALSSNSEPTKQNQPTLTTTTTTEESIYQRVDVQSVRTCIRSSCGGLIVSMDEAAAFAEDILSRAKNPKDPTAYVRAVIVKDPKAVEARITKGRPVREVKADPTCPRHPGYPFPCKRCEEGT